MIQGKQLPDSKIQEIAVLANMGNGGKKIAKKAKVSRSTANKYQRLTDKIRDLKKDQTIDNSWRIIEKADKITLDKIEEVGAKDAAIIGKIQTDRLLDLTDPTRSANKNETKILVIPAELVSKYDISVSQNTERSS